MAASATLHMLCGKIASGKSTLAARLARAPHTVLLSQDHLLSRLYPGEILALQDFVRRSGHLRDAIGPHIQSILSAGISVVLDFEANTPSSRFWMRDLFESANAGHMLHFLDVPDAECLERLHLRNAAGTHEYVVSEDEFALFTSHFVPPTDDEGFVIERHTS